MFGLGMGELVVIFCIILLLFGAEKLPEVAKSLGRSLKDFKKAANDIRESIDVDLTGKNDHMKPATPAAIDTSAAGITKDTLTGAAKTA